MRISARFSVSADDEGQFLCGPCVLDSFHHVYHINLLVLESVPHMRRIWGRRENNITGDAISTRAR